ncbi:unnamed protein product [Clonostachys rosea f. rosea IK726]|uniref:Uncharacterized protein n=2 Tax=Clonostachys rosea f. rosea IK726 TaxID=1349383 RepID=A0ACA9UDJ3_BIOOC|nr:unnamed protein product [Clonostachys rosea f. rosea IK726]CAG9951416.1 unnamed protein product [Clonostachys rosea f. rosea IK726]
MNGIGYTYSFDTIKYLLYIQKLYKQKYISSIQNAGGIEIHTKGTLSKATPRKGASAKKASGQGYCKCFTRDNSEIDDDFKKEEGLPEVERSPSKKLYFFFWLPLIVHWLRLQDLRN